MYCAIMLHYQLVQGCNNVIIVKKNHYNYHYNYFSDFNEFYHLVLRGAIMLHFAKKIWRGMPKTASAMA